MQWLHENYYFVPHIPNHGRWYDKRLEYKAWRDEDSLISDNSSTVRLAGLTYCSIESACLGLSPGSTTHLLCDPRQVLLCEMSLVILHRVDVRIIEAICIWLKSQILEQAKNSLILTT